MLIEHVELVKLASDLRCVNWSVDFFNIMILQQVFSIFSVDRY